MLKGEIDRTLEQVGQFSEIKEKKIKHFEKMSRGNLEESLKVYLGKRE